MKVRTIGKRHNKTAIATSHLKNLRANCLSRDCFPRLFLPVFFFTPFAFSGFDLNTGLTIGTGFAFADLAAEAEAPFALFFFDCAKIPNPALKFNIPV